MILSGINTLTGGASVQEGALLVNGVLPDVSVSIDGTLGGSGAVTGSINVMVGGAVAPGNSIGTLQADNVTFVAGTFFDVEVDADGNSDLLQVDNEATINGGTVRVFAGAGDYAPSTLYTILTANDVVGAFDDVTSNFAFLSPTLSYDTNNVFLTLDLVAAFQDVAHTPNQRSVAGAADALGGGNDIYDEILVMTDEEARAAFDALSGEIHASAKPPSSTRRSKFVKHCWRVSGRCSAAVLNRQRWRRRLPPATERFQATDPSSGVMLSVQGETDGNGNAASVDRTSGGFLGGADKAVGDIRVGLARSATADPPSMSMRGSLGQARSDTTSRMGAGAKPRRVRPRRHACLCLSAGGNRSHRAAAGGDHQPPECDYDAHVMQAAAEIGTDLGAAGPGGVHALCRTRRLFMSRPTASPRPAVRRRLRLPVRSNTTAHIDGRSQGAARKRKRRASTVLWPGVMLLGDVEPTSRAASRLGARRVVHGPRRAAPPSVYACWRFEAARRCHPLPGAQTVHDARLCVREYGSDGQDHGVKAELTFRLRRGVGRMRVPSKCLICFRICISGIFRCTAYVPLSSACMG